MVIELDLVDIKRVITKDGRDIGVVSGCILDTSNWTVTSLIVKVEKEVAKQLQVKKKLIGQTQITIQTNMVGNLADVAQLSIDFNALKSHLGG